MCRRSFPKELQKVNLERLRKRIEKLEGQRNPEKDLVPGSEAWWEHWGPIVRSILDGEPGQLTIEAYRVLVALAEGDPAVDEESSGSTSGIHSATADV